MKVICAGPSRTGTKSFSAALRHLGYTVYEWEESLFYHGKEWIKIVEQGWTTEDFRKMYENVDAVADNPGFHFWEEILEAFPDAKLILIHREEYSWVESWVKVNEVYASRPLLDQLQAYLSPTAMRFRHALELTMGLFSGMPVNSFCRPWRRRQVTNKQLSLKKYRQHIEDVKRRAPKENFLIYKIEEGWEPLCKFLGKEVPDIPFPHLNKGANMIQSVVNQELAKQVRRESIKSLALLAGGASTIALCYVIYKGKVSQVSKFITESFTKLI